MKHEDNYKNCIALLPVFYTPKMVADFRSTSPSAGKPARVVAAWQRLELPIEIFEPEPVTAYDFKLAHSPDYVDKILACEMKNGFGNKLPEVADPLIYTSGSMLSAAREAIRNGKVAVAPCSGFHHAKYASAFGYAIKIAHTSRYLKALAKELDVPIIVISSVEHDLEERSSKRPLLTDLPGMAAIANAADLVLFVYRDEVYDPDTEEKGTAQIIVSMHRNGSIGSFSLKYDGLCGSFEKMDHGV